MTVGMHFAVVVIRLFVLGKRRRRQQEADRARGWEPVTHEFSGGLTVFA